MNQRMLDEFIELAKIDVSSKKETEIANVVKQKLIDLGFSVKQDDAGTTFDGECGNIIGVLEGTKEGSILLCSHLDRVPNGIGIKPIEKDGILYSDGTTILAADDISGICAILEGIRKIQANHESHPRIEVVFCVGEEIGLFGSKALDYSQFQSKLAYIFDSPGRTGRFIQGAPGHFGIEVDIYGKPAHAGNEPEKGIDAAKIMCDMLSTLKQGRIDEITTSNFPILMTDNLSCNVVCDHAKFKGEARSRDQKKLLDYIEYFKKHCQKVADENHAKIEMNITPTFVPFFIHADHEILQKAKHACDVLNINMTIETGGGGMDANVFNEKGIVTVGVATGYSKNHTKEEQLILEDFYLSAELCAQLIREY